MHKEESDMVTIKMMVPFRLGRCTADFDAKIDSDTIDLTGITVSWPNSYAKFKGVEEHRRISIGGA